MNNTLSQLLSKYQPKSEMIEDGKFIYCPLYEAGAFLHNNNNYYLSEEAINECSPGFTGTNINLEHNGTIEYGDQIIGDVVDVWHNKEGFVTDSNNKVNADDLWWTKIFIDNNKFPIAYIDRMGGISTEFTITADEDYVHNGIKYQKVLNFKPTGISLVSVPKFNVCREVKNSLVYHMDNMKKDEEVKNQDTDLTQIIMEIAKRLDAIEGKLNSNGADVKTEVENQDEGIDAKKDEEVKNQDEGTSAYELGKQFALGAMEALKAQSNSQNSDQKDDNDKVCNSMSKSSGKSLVELLQKNNYIDIKKSETININNINDFL